MPFSCSFCEAITEVKDLDTNVECLGCHNIMLHPREHNKIINRGLDNVEFTRLHFPEFNFLPEDTKFMYCSQRNWQGDGLWCRKFRRPCLGSCEWKRERILKRQANIAEWFQ